MTKKDIQEIEKVHKEIEKRLSGKEKVVYFSYSEYKLFDNLEDTLDLISDSSDGRFSWNIKYIEKKQYMYPSSAADSDMHRTTKTILVPVGVGVKITNPKKLDEIFQKVLMFEDKPVTIKYNATTGTGSVQSKIFKLKDGQADFKVFGELYKNINKSVRRIDVLVLIGSYKKGEELDLERKITDTYEINELVKGIRKKTDLNPRQLVNNKGNLTLLSLI